MAIIEYTEKIHRAFETYLSKYLEIDDEQLIENDRESLETLLTPCFNVPIISALLDLLVIHDGDRFIKTFKKFGEGSLVFLNQNQNSQNLAYRKPDLIVKYEQDGVHTLILFEYKIKKSISDLFFGTVSADNNISEFFEGHFKNKLDNCQEDYLKIFGLKYDKCQGQLERKNWGGGMFTDLSKCVDLFSVESERQQDLRGYVFIIGLHLEVDQKLNVTNLKENTKELMREFLNRICNIHHKNFYILASPVNIQLNSKSHQVLLMTWGIELTRKT